MKKLLIGLLLAFCVNAYAETQIVYDVSRQGEGAVIQESGKQLVFILFTHWDDALAIRPPIVSPAPPPRLELEDKHNFWVIGVSRDFDGEVGTGEVYFDVQHDDFPLTRLSKDGSGKTEVSQQYTVGSFLIEKDMSGEDNEWWLVIESNGILTNKTIFYSIFHFDTPLRD